MTGRTVLKALRATLSYHPATGRFIRLGSTASNARAGDEAGSLNGKGYRCIYVGGKQYRAARLAWLWMTGDWPPGVVDHVNGDRSDDRWSNLRAATIAENNANAKRRRDNRSGQKGVRKMRGRWQVRLGNGGSQHIGTFDTEQEARAAYEAAARERFGEFARPE